MSLISIFQFHKLKVYSELQFPLNPLKLFVNPNK